MNTTEKGGPPPGWAGASATAQIPANIYRYVLATSGWHQVALVALTVAVFLLEIVPLELQRRVVNDLVKHREYRFIIILCAVYAGTVLVQGGTKLVLNVYRSWVGERATRDLRRRVHALVSSTSAATVGRWRRAAGPWGRKATRPGARSMDPARGRMRPARVRSSVLLPEPFGPRRTRTSPARPSRSTAATTGWPAGPTETPESDHRTSP